MATELLRSYFSQASSDPQAASQIKDQLKKRPLKQDTCKLVINELYEIYSQVLIKQNDLKKEIFFMEVLQLISDILVEHDDPKLFVQRYLKCAIDTAGYDLTLCRMSRDLLVTLSSKDPRQASRILNHLVKTYTGETQVLPDSVDKRTQDYEEHKRFIRSNCEQLIGRICNDIGISLFYDELLESMKIAKVRPVVLDLLSTVLSKTELQDVHSVLDSVLFNDLFQCLYYDECTVTLNIALTCLTLFMPHVVEKVRLVDLLLVYTRAVTLSLDDDDGSPFAEKPDPVESLGADLKHWDRATNPADSQANDLHYSKLFVFLYGLYPVNLVAFIRDPDPYFHQLDTSLLSRVLTDNRNYDFFEVRTISNNLLSQFKLHSNFSIYDSAELELKDHLRFRKLRSPDEIASMCLEHMVDLKSLEPEGEGELSHLMDTHKELYTGTNMQQRKGSVSHDLSGSSSHLDTSADNSDLTTNQGSLGDAELTNIEFYKRELLLIRNELNFAVYLKYLNESKLRAVLEQSRNEQRNTKVIESSMMNLKILNNKNLLLTKNYQQLREEHNKYKNERLKYEQVLLGKNKSLRKQNEENLVKIKTLQLDNEELSANLAEISRQSSLKDVEISLLKLNQLEVGHE